MKVTREQALRYRWRAQGLDAAEGTVGITDVPVLDLGLQDGTGAAGRTALLARGVDLATAVEVTGGFTDTLALAWTLRGAPHFYRRAELPDVATAVSPFTEDDAAKRVVSAGKTLHDKGKEVLGALAEVGARQREAAGDPLDKGALSTALREVLPEHLLVACRPCGCVHCSEQLFRLAPLHAGLELEPGTSPPVLRRVPGWPGERPIGPAPDPLAAPEALQPIRAYLHLLGPATPADVATYLEAPTRVVKQRWPADVVEVDRAGTRASILEADAEALAAAADPGDTARVRLLSGFDLFTAAKDRALLTDEPARRKELWPVLGRPGVIARDGDLLGTWRPKATGGRLRVRLNPWYPLDAATRSGLEERADLLARSRGRTFAGFTEQ